MRLTLQAYFVICLVIAAAAIVLKPIYTKAYANVPNAFAPTHIAIATTSPCEAYALSASTNKIALDYDKAQEPFRFYTIANPSALESKELDSSPHICALARNAITAPLTSLKLSANASDMENVEFVAITMGSESFYIPRDSVLGLERVGFLAKNGDCCDESAVITTQGNSLASPCKAPFLSQKSCREQLELESSLQQSPISTTAKQATAVQGEAAASFFRIPRILDSRTTTSSSSRAAQSGVAIHKSAILARKPTPEPATLDLSSYKLHPSSEILNLYGPTIFDSIYLGFLYYFLSPPFLFIWLACAWVFIALKPSRQNLAAKYQEPIALALLLALALIVRLYHYDSFSLWGDELYSVGVVGYPDGDFTSVFKDPGNPPFYNFLLKLWLHCFGYTSGAARSLGVVIGVMGVVGIYLLLRDHACENSTLSSRSGVAIHKSTQVDSRGDYSAIAESMDSKETSPNGERCPLFCHDFASAKSRNDNETTQTPTPSDSKILDEKCGLQGKSQGSYLDGNDRRDFSPLPHFSLKAESPQRQKPTLIPTLGAFFYAISFVAIGAAHEVRGYVLELALLPFVFYFLLHFLKNPRLSNALGYVLLGAMVCNTHYFGAVMILAGFIASAVLLYQDTELDTRKKRKRLAGLLGLNILIASSLVPFFAITAFSQALSDTSFNTWIPAPSLNGLLQLLPQAFGSSSGAFVFIVAFLLTPMLKNRFLNFCAIIIALGVLLPFIASFVRPIYYPKYAVYATYAFMLALCTTAIVLFARKVAGKNASFLIALLVCMLSVSLLDHRVQPIGIGDNTRAKFRFITLDSSNEANKSSTKPRIYIIDLHTAMATKQRQYEIYGLKPSAEFLRISAPELAQREFDKGDVLYLDGYFIDNPTMQAILSALSAKGARIQPIPFGIQEERDLKESQDLIYKVIF